MGLFDKMGAAYKVLRQGEELADAEKWKAHQITGGVIAAFLGAILVALKAFGVDVPAVSDGDLSVVGGAVVVIVGLASSYLTAATSTRAGLKPSDDASTPADRGRSAGGL